MEKPSTINNLDSFQDNGINDSDITVSAAADPSLKAANITVVTDVANKCQKTVCDTQPEDLLVRLFEFKRGLLEPTVIKTFNGSASGWVIDLLPPIQYAVRIEAREANYSSDCHGIIYSGQAKDCEINVTITDPIPVKAESSNMTIKTNILNNCKSVWRCEDIKAEDFEIKIYEFQDESQTPIKEIKSFAGSKDGWRITSLPQSIQYDIKQFNPVRDNVLVNTNYSSGCHGIVHTEEIKCIIDTELITMLDRNRTATLDIN